MADVKVSLVGKDTKFVGPEQIRDNIIVNIPDFRKNMERGL